jgi:hypothetical protein
MTNNNEEGGAIRLSGRDCQTIIIKQIQTQVVLSLTCKKYSPISNAE